MVYEELLDNEGYENTNNSEDYYYCGNCLTKLEFEAGHCEHCESRDVKYHHGCCEDCDCCC